MRMSETSQALKTDEDKAYRQFYTKILSDLRPYVDLESISTLPYKHAIGLRIIQARAELMSIRPIKDEKGWNKELGNLTTSLERDLDYGRTTLGYCYRFAMMFPVWERFAEFEFDALRGDVNGVDKSPTEKVLGKNLTWREVISLVTEEKAKVTVGQRVKASETQSSSKPSMKSVTLELPNELWETLEAIASTTTEKTERIIVMAVTSFVQEYIANNTVKMGS
jgi:hypothetical protein